MGKIERLYDKPLNKSFLSVVDDCHSSRPADAVRLHRNDGHRLNCSSWRVLQIVEVVHSERCVRDESHVRLADDLVQVLLCEQVHFVRKVARDSLDFHEELKINNSC